MPLSQTALNDPNQLLHSIESLAEIGYWSFNVSSGEVFWSEGVFGMHDMSTEEAIPSLEGLLDRFDADDAELLRGRIQEALELGVPYEIDLRLSGYGNDGRVLRSRGQPVFDDAGRITGLFGVLQDITVIHCAQRQLESQRQALRESVARLQGLLADKQRAEVQLRREIQTRQALEDRLRKMAMYDTLTGVPNRRQLLGIAGMEVSRARRYGRPMSVLLLDIDHFKQINDVHGHAVGDEALVHLATVASEALRDSDSLGRTGGEEFVVLLPETDAAGASVVAERLRAVVAQTPAITGAGPIPMSLSIGIAEVERGESVDQVIHHADAAMYAAKQGGRNRWALAEPRQTARCSA